MSSDFVQGGAVVLAALIALWGVLATVRQSRRAAESTKTMEAKAVDAAAYERARDSYEAAIRTNESEIQRYERLVDGLNERIDRLESGRREDRAEIDSLVSSLTRTRQDYENHLARCRVREQEMQQRLEAYERLHPEI